MGIFIRAICLSASVTRDLLRALSRELYTQIMDTAVSSAAAKPSTAATGAGAGAAVSHNNIIYFRMVQQPYDRAIEL